MKGRMINFGSGFQRFQSMVNRFLCFGVALKENIIV
jgi:hypothetical protein